MFGPWVDLLFVVNITWPLVLLVMIAGGIETQLKVSFWQIYFVTTPHRWMTLAIVFCDGDRFRERSRAFLGVAVAVAVACFGIRLSTGTLTCLLAVDYAWNAWHFAAQHHGIFRIYGRIGQPERTDFMALEKVLMRFFVLYVAFRTATWALPASAFGATSSRFEAARNLLDFAVLAVPLVLLLREFAAFDRRAVGRLAYLLSFSGLYCGLLLSVNRNRPALVLMFTTASALFHAVEYLAIVSWSVRSRHGNREEKATIFRRLLPQWALCLLIFAAVIGSGNWLMQHHLLQAWLLLNVIVAFLHYTYDGMIWKSRRRVRPAAGHSE